MAGRALGVSDISSVSSVFCKRLVMMYGRTGTYDIHVSDFDQIVLPQK